jgi:hypothetical protein
MIKRLAELVLGLDSALQNNGRLPRRWKSDV